MRFRRRCNYEAGKQGPVTVHRFSFWALPSFSASTDFGGADFTCANTTSVVDFLDKNKALAEQLTRSAFDIATAEIQASEKLLTKIKAPVAPSNLVRPAHSRRGGLAATSTVAAQPSTVCSTSVEHVGVRQVPLSVPSSLELRPGHSASASQVAYTLGSIFMTVISGRNTVCKNNTYLKYS